VILALLLAATCAAEVSLQPDPRECAIMWHVQARKGGDLASQVRRFHSYWRSPEQQAARPWILELANGKAPSRYPGNWKKDSERWHDYVLAANEFLRGELPDPCPTADDYGARCGDEHVPGRATCDHPPRACMIPASCGDTLQQYWDVRPCRTVRASLAAVAR
jgi:hypothetical protein